MYPKAFPSLCLQEKSRLWQHHALGEGRIVMCLLEYMWKHFITVIIMYKLIRPRTSGPAYNMFNLHWFCIMQNVGWNGQSLGPFCFAWNLPAKLVTSEVARPALILPLNTHSSTSSWRQVSRPLDDHCSWYLDFCDVSASYQQRDGVQQCCHLEAELTKPPRILFALLTWLHNFYRLEMELLKNEVFLIGHLVPSFALWPTWKL